jgi:RNA polymerase sigma-70 factor, ECF subfamily
VTFRELQVSCSEPDLDVIAVDEALSALANHDERLARVMEQRYFGGFTLHEISELEGRSLATIKRDWLYARAWLYEYITSTSAAMAQAGTR